ncbi:glycosyltransferase family 2 protein [Chitinophaga sp. sic0106]|uniref:glycosyltransferase family 2 protein n=1 Tax=Chitinophaga sp. sic0106 TaxID=2854785 RepID=UPI001C441C53|nr:glycosyltransferase family 2 protein [Chitinophaga sp. sic0106]MBV7528468.1 glycosyltransferase family 2 protein [Chitinophaga sp. sic0106]
MRPTVTLLIATYNWPAALKLCLESVRQQTVMPKEVIVADDGSREETTELIKSFQQNFPVPLIHIWQPDDGFRLAQIRNKGIAAASGDYVIQLDGDLILEKHFIADHIATAEPGYFVTGSRVCLTKEITEQVFVDQSLDIKRIPAGYRFNSMRIPLVANFMAKKYKMKGRHKYYVKGCNMAFWKKDLIMVNGYDEIFVGWGMEDTDIAIRLLNSGIRKKFIKMRGVVYHLFHNEASRSTHLENVRLTEVAIAGNKKVATKGLSEYLDK